MSDQNNNISTQFIKMTKTPVPKLLISLSIPTVCSMLISSAYNMADSAFVGLLGTSQSAAISIVLGFMSVLQAIGFFFGQGSGSIMSRELGARDPEAASHTASTGFFMSLFLSTFIAILSIIFINPLVHILGSTPTIAPYAKQYLIFIIVSAPFTVTSFTMNNLLRYEGKAKLGAIAMMTGALLNIAGDPLFMFVFKMDIYGAGLSTAIAQTISFAILLSMYLRKKTQTTLSIKYFTNDLNKIFNIMGTGLPSLIRQCLNGISIISLTFVSKPYDDAAIAAMGIVSKISFFVISVGLGIGQGFQPISSFNFGSKNYKRVREAYKDALILSEILMAVFSLVTFIFAPQIIKIFRDDPAVWDVGTRALRLQVASLLFMPLCMISEMLLQTTGNKFGASILSSVRSGIFFIPLLFIMSFLRGINGIQEAQPLAYILSVIPAMLFMYPFFRKLPKEDAQ